MFQLENVRFYRLFHPLLRFYNIIFAVIRQYKKPYKKYKKRKYGHILHFDKFLRVINMYQCTWFYTSNLILPKDKNAVAAAWCVEADEFYRYELQEDALSLKNMYCFVRTVDGEGCLETINGSKIILPENTYMIIKRDRIKEYRSTKKIWNYYWVDFLYQTTPGIKTEKTYPSEFSEHERELFAELLDIGRQFPSEIEYINSVFTHYYYNLTLKRIEKPRSATHSVKLSEVCAYIQQKLYSRLTVTEIANFFNVSSRRIHQIFNDTLHVSPKQYISDLKIEKAKQILEKTSMPIIDIADALGYYSAYHFSSTFQRKTGCSPSAYRRKLLSKPTDK